MKMSKREMPEELLLLLEKVEKEGAGVTIPYVHPKLPIVYQRPSFFKLRVLRKPGQPLVIRETLGAAGQPQNTLPITIPSHLHRQS